MISRAESGDMYRGLPGQKLKPSESAPHSSATAASSRVRMPQTFTLTRYIIRMSVVGCPLSVVRSRLTCVTKLSRGPPARITDYGPPTTDAKHFNYQLEPFHSLPTISSARRRGHLPA